MRRLKISKKTHAPAADFAMMLIRLNVENEILIRRIVVKKTDKQVILVDEPMYKSTYRLMEINSVMTYGSWKRELYPDYLVICDMDRVDEFRKILYQKIENDLARALSSLNSRLALFRELRAKKLLV